MTLVGVMKPQNDRDHYSIAYSNFVVPLVKAVQERQYTLDSMKLKINMLERLNETKDSDIDNLQSIQAKEERIKQTCKTCRQRMKQIIPYC